ncbi:MAG: hypothetical protein CBC29_06830 [Methylococcaceae bacterium TMED69]|nr:MAG: hypothetical protein CBC29_06830 [Methylococcaceae bacterium TMED69]
MRILKKIAKGEKMSNTKVENGNTVFVHYVGTLDDGTEFDNSRDRGEPFSFVVGTGSVIKGFDEGVVGLEVGETSNINIPPEKAYGPYNNEAIRVVPKSQFPEGFEFTIGGFVRGKDGATQQDFWAQIKEDRENEVVMDFNHRLAGKNLNFSVEVIKVD